MEDCQSARPWLLYCSLNIPHPPVNTNATWLASVNESLVDVPPWVLDSVIIHELAHLIVPQHGPEFDRIVQRYPLHERATGYLMAVSDRLNALPPSELAN